MAIKNKIYKTPTVKTVIFQIQLSNLFMIENMIFKLKLSFLNFL